VHQNPTNHRLTFEALRDESGQATTEYALVLLGAALVALILVAWAGSGGASGRIGQLFDSVIDTIMSKL
jgi:Flp pilus assembly pilin Flp